jgi:hypothetical protein
MYENRHKPFKRLHYFVDCASLFIRAGFVGGAEPFICVIGGWVLT